MKHLLFLLLLTGCATQPVYPVHTYSTEPTIYFNYSPAGIYPRSYYHDHYRGGSYYRGRVDHYYHGRRR